MNISIQATITKSDAFPELVGQSFSTPPSAFPIGGFFGSILFGWLKNADIKGKIGVVASGTDITETISATTGNGILDTILSKILAQLKATQNIGAWAEGEFVALFPAGIDIEFDAKILEA